MWTRLLRAPRAVEAVYKASYANRSPVPRIFLSTEHQVGHPKWRVFVSDRAAEVCGTSPSRSYMGMECSPATLINLSLAIEQSESEKQL